VVAATTVASASSTPSLPPRSPAQLLAEVAQGSARPLGPFTATVQESSDLGLPALPSTGSGSGAGPFSMGSANQATSIWYLNPQHVRIAVVTPMQESDLRLDGRTLWLWDSKTQTATRVRLPATLKVPARRLPSGQGISVGPVTPQAAARQLLKAVGPTTVVSVQRNVSVAGRPAYQLSLVPKSSGSLVGQVLIAIDATRHIPLRLEVIPRGSSSPAYEIGFTSLTFGAPAASNFAFTPPRGAKIKTVTAPALPSGLVGGLGLRSLLGGIPFGWIGHGAAAVPWAVAAPDLRPQSPKQVLQRVRAMLRAHLPKGSTKAQRAKILKNLERRLAARPGAVTKRIRLVLPSKPAASSAALGANAPSVIGKSWLTVIATPPNPAIAGAVRALLTRTSKISVYTPASVGVGDPVCCPTSFKVEAEIASALSSDSSNPTVSGEVVTGTGAGTTPGPVAPAGPDAAVLRALLKAMTPVHGSWGSGRLLRTSLLSVLITSNGRILAGAVTPAVLYADAALPVK
jgi:outer membrane lipoprotein-sorting protein